MSSKRAHAQKTILQLDALEHEYRLDKTFNKERIAYISNYTKLSQSAVYKWIWDRKKGLLRNRTN